MLQRVTLEGVELPRLYIAETQSDIFTAQQNGIPYIKWKHGNDKLIKVLLRPTLEKMFPGLKWNKILGTKKNFKTNVYLTEHNDKDFDGELNQELVTTHPTTVEKGKVHELTEDECSTASISNGTRIFTVTDKVQANLYKQCSIEEYIGDVSSWVNLDVLQSLHLMPKFIGDILDCVKTNIVAGVKWNEGYNKKLGNTLGNFNRSTQLPNLIILDVSGSIPRGISATMLALIDTLRTQVDADLIITAKESRFYPSGSELPGPNTLRMQYGYGNESKMFFDILTTDIQGKHYGHVISFGDSDTPNYRGFQARPEVWSLCGTQVEHVHHFHTRCKIQTGYAKWCHYLSAQPQIEYNTEWCEVIKENL